MEYCVYGLKIVSHQPTIPLYHCILRTTSCYKNAHKSEKERTIILLEGEQDTFKTTCRYALIFVKHHQRASGYSTCIN